MLTLNKVSALTEDQARETLERILWPQGPVCPHCGSVENLTRMQGEAHRAGLFQCNNCGQQFTVTIGTIFEDSHIPLRKWLMAFALLCSAKKGISALQLQRELDLGSYRTAWFMAHRIREAMKREPLAGLLRGQVEVDETYVGGKPRPKAGEPRQAKRGRGTKKIPVVALVERNGDVRAHKVARVDGATLRQAIRDNVDRRDAMLFTDELSIYHAIGREFRYGHRRVNHSAGEYARGGRRGARQHRRALFRAVEARRDRLVPPHQQRAPGPLLRGVQLPLEHAEPGRQRDRTAIALRQSKGKRLTYKQPIRD